jgi:hypothetical protein
MEGRERKDQAPAGGSFFKRPAEIDRLSKQLPINAVTPKYFPKKLSGNVFTKPPP